MVDGNTSSCSSFQADFTLITESGDELYLAATARIDGSHTLCSGPGAVAHFEATFTITGGSGAFASAGGGGVMQGTLATRSPNATTDGWDLDFAWDGGIATEARAPFSADGDGTVDLSLPCPPDLCVIGQGTFKGSHLGEGTFEAEIRLHPVTTADGETVCREFTAFVDFTGDEDKALALRATGVVVGEEDYCSGLSRMDFEGTWAVVGGTDFFTGGGSLAGAVISRSTLIFHLDGFVAR